MAWAIDHSRKVVFIHVPKTGGRSLFHREHGAFANFLDSNLRHLSGHHPISGVARDVGKSFPDFTSLAVIRDPYDRIVSLYLNDLRTIGRDVPLDRWLSQPPTPFRYPGLFPQTHWLMLNGELVIDHLFDFPNLEDCKNSLCEHLGIAQNKVALPHIGRTARGPWQEYFTQKALDIFNTIHQKDFDLLGFERYERL